MGCCLPQPEASCVAATTAPAASQRSEASQHAAASLRRSVGLSLHRRPVVRSRPTSVAACATNDLLPGRDSEDGKVSGHQRCVSGTPMVPGGTGTTVASS